jgi:protein O-mannosyl-transferase
LLATFFYLAAFLLFIKGAQKHKSLYYIGVFFSALLSMGSKEWAVTLPAMLMLYDYMFLSERNVKNVLSHWKAYVLAALPWALIAYNLNLTTTGGNTSLGFNIVTTSGITPVTYLLTSFNVLWTYIRLLLLPINQNLDYDYPIAKTLFEFPTLFSFVGHVAVVGVSFWLYKKKGWLLMPFGVAWFYIALSPVQSFVPIIDVIFEHRLYMPSIGFFLLFVVAYESLFEWWEVKQFFKKSAVV